MFSEHQAQREHQALSNEVSDLFVLQLIKYTNSSVGLESKL